MTHARLLGGVSAAAVLAVLAGALLLGHRGWAPFPAAGTPQAVGLLTGDSGVTLSVDLGSRGTPISPGIYGVAFADAATLRRLGATLDRWGGNASTRYNWTAAADNSARDWEFRNKPGGDWAGFVQGARDGGAAALITIPTIGWVARNSDNGTRSTGVPAAGGPAVSAAGAISGYDPGRNRLVTSVPSLPSRPAGAPADAIYQDEFVRALVQRFGAASVPFLSMDNEPDAWSVTHTDVHPAQMGYQDMLRNYLDYAPAVKAADRGAAVAAPELCCWTSLFYSALDRGSDNFRSHRDRAAHGDVPFLDWWLGQVAAADRAAGNRTLGLLSVHFYPQADGVYSDRADPATRALRVRSTHSLWDAAYVDESWIGDHVELLPRLQRIVDARYPGTPIGITEYSFGGEHDASGAVAQAEALGIFGRAGVAVAATWTHPAPDSPAGAAFRLFRNYDGAGAAFGDVSLPVRAGGTVAAFAARHSNSNEVDIVVANESTTSPATVHVKVSGRPAAEDARYIVDPGSGEIASAGPAAATTLPPLGLALLRYRV